jgi:hypothetical protein
MGLAANSTEGKLAHSIACKTTVLAIIPAHQRLPSKTHLKDNQRPVVSTPAWHAGKIQVIKTQKKTPGNPVYCTHALQIQLLQIQLLQRGISSKKLCCFINWRTLG